MVAVQEGLFWEIKRNWSETGAERNLPLSFQRNKRILMKLPCPYCERKNCRNAICRQKENAYQAFKAADKASSDCFQEMAQKYEQFIVRLELHDQRKMDQLQKAENMARKRFHQMIPLEEISRRVSRPYEDIPWIHIQNHLTPQHKRNPVTNVAQMPIQNVSTVLSAESPLAKTHFANRPSAK